MMTIFMIGLVLGIVATRMVCLHQHGIELVSSLSQAERRAYATGYEHGSLPGQRVLRKLAIIPKGPILASELEPTVLNRLAQRWAKEGRRMNCHAWLAVVVALTPEESWTLVGCAIGAALMLAAVVMVLISNCDDVDEATSDWLKEQAGKQQAGSLSHDDEEDES